MLGATDPTAWLKLGTVGVWISKDFTEKIELESGVLERKFKFDEMKKNSTRKRGGWSENVCWSRFLLCENISLFPI